MVQALAFLGEERQEIELHGGVPVEQLGVGMVLFELLTLYGVGAYHLSHEVIVACRILRVHKRSGGVGLYGVLEDTPVGIVAIYDAGRDVGGEGEEPALCRVHHRGARAVLLTL